MKTVNLENFKIPIRRKNVEDIVFRKDSQEGGFILGFTPGDEFVYNFECSPDVFFQDLSIKEVYYEPYRTFLRLSKPEDIEISWPGSSDKLYVKGKTIGGGQLP